MVKTKNREEKMKSFALATPPFILENWSLKGGVAKSEIPWYVHEEVHKHIFVFQATTVTSWSRSTYFYTGNTW